MTKMAQEDPFDTLGNSIQQERKWYKIPEQLLKRAQEKFKHLKGERTNIVRSFGYDIEYECFHSPNIQEVHSLFFDGILGTCVESDSVFENFFVLKFGHESNDTEDTFDDFILDRDEMVEKILRHGVTMDDAQYNIIGCSNSQVQEKSFYFMKGSRKDCDQYLLEFIPNLNDFERLKGVAKRTKYAGLLFTGCQHIVKLPKFAWERKEDVTNDNYNFTDGCGLISYQLAREIRDSHPILQKKWKHKIPSVWQVRYFGHGFICKGLLVVDYSEEKKNVMTMRKSMLKLDVNGHSKVAKFLQGRLGIVSTSLRAKIGKLNKQVVTLLSANVDTGVLLSVQDDYQKTIKQARTIPAEAFKSSAMKKQWPLVQSVFRQSAINNVLPKAYTSLIRSIEPTSISGRPQGRKNEQLQISLASSRLLFGASIPEHLHSVLQEGQCIVFTEFGCFEGTVIVSRSPSYSPGDVRVLEAIKPNDNNPVSKLKNVIIFSTTGRRPDPDKMSGGDLDGDLYLVIWDPTLIASSDNIKKEVAAEYNVSESPKTGESKSEDWIRYIARWENTLLSQIDACFFQFAAEKGVKSKECRELCDLFSRAVDQNPSDLKQLKQLSSACYSRRDLTSIVRRPTHKLPVWDQMLKSQILCSGDLNKRPKFPTDEDWKIFYKNLIWIDPSDVDETFYNPIFTACVDEQKLFICQVLWKRMCKGKNLPFCNFEIPMPTAKMCSKFDCLDTACEFQHIEDPVFYQNEWEKRMDEEIMEVIGKSLDELQNAKEIMKQQNEFHLEGQQLQEQALGCFHDKLEELLKKKSLIDTLKGTFAKIEDKEKQLQLLSRNITAPSFMERVYSFFSSTYAAKLKEEEKRVLDQVEEQTNVLVRLHNQSLQEENDLRRCLGMVTINIPTVLDELRSQEFRCRREKELKSVIQTSLSHELLQHPKLGIVPSSAENLERLLCLAYTKVEEQKEKIEITENECIQVQNELDKKLHEMKKTVINLDNLDLIKKKLQKLQEKCNQCLSILDDKSLRSDQSNLTTCIDSYIDTVLEDQLFHTTNNDIVEEMKILSFGTITEKCARMKNALGVFKRRSEENDQKKERELICQNKFKESETILKKKLLKIQKRQNEIQQQLKSEEKQLQSHCQLIDKVYDPEKVSMAIQDYESISDKIKCFDLALCALKHEVESRFSDCTKVTNEHRITCTQELTFALQREKKRCQRELSENRLPVFSKRNTILEALVEHDAVIVVAQTGSGKSTQVPQYLADDLHHALGRTKKFPKIVCTQPRRVAAMRIAERVSLEYAGALSVNPQPATSEELQQRPGTVRVAAYPLYAALNHLDQDRALDRNDRVGFHKEFCSEEKGTRQDSGGSAICLKDTVGEVGGWVGFQIGSKGKSLEERKKCKKITEDTRIQFVTEGLLFQKLKSDLNLAQYQCVIIDEAHERGKDTDLLLAHLKKVVENSDSKLKVVVMSASIDEKMFSDYFGGCPIVKCEGKMFDVEIIYRKLPKIVLDKPKESFSDDSFSDSDSDYDCWDTDSDAKSATGKVGVKKKNSGGMNKLILHAVNVLFEDIMERGGPGDVLVFLPGRKEIHSCVDMINERAEEESDDSSVTCVRKVVCCTNIAETSLTIPDVRFVIDAGKAKKIIYDHKLRVSALKLLDTSQASAKQRKGRAGRVQSGWCYRLYSEKYMLKEMPEFDDPEMKQRPIDELYLYALDVYGRLEDIELMPDAKLSDQAILHGKRRLLNLKYINEIETGVGVTKEGKIALMLMGDVPLEGAKMILSAKKFGIVEDALSLAVLLQYDIYVNRSRNNDDECEIDNEKKMKLEDETGDHLTVLNVYKNFKQNLKGKGSKEKKEDRTKKWCKSVGCSYSSLKQIQNSIDKVYQSLKKNKWYGDVMENGSKVNTSKPSDEKDHSSSLVENKAELLQCLVAGYFHNIAQPNDPDYVKSGYSLITPTNYGDNVDGSNDADLLKVSLSKFSSIYTFGDSKLNTTVLFDTLFMTQQEHVYMKVASKIKTEWLQEYASNRWIKSVGLSFSRDEKTEKVEMQSFVTRRSIPKVGPKILAAVLKETRENQPLRCAVEKESNAKMRPLFDTAEIMFYGSKKETGKAVTDVQKYVDEKKEAEKRKDKIIRYPNTNDKMAMCDIRSGFMLTNTSLCSLIPCRITDWNLIQSGTLIFSKLELSKSETEIRIKSDIDCVKGSLPLDILEDWKDPNIFFCNNNFTKVNFHCQELANRVCDALQIHFYGRVNCFMDKEVQISVRRTDLYPSVRRAADHFPFVQVEDKKWAFKIKLQKKSPRQSQNQIDQFIEYLRLQKVFGSCVLEDLSVSIPFGEREFIYWQIKQQFTSNAEVEICCRKHPTPRIEIFGECEPREKWKKAIKEYIKELRAEISSGEYIRTYHHKIPVTKREDLARILRCIKELRKKHSNVTISVLGGGAHSHSNNNAICVIQLLSDSYEDGEKAKTSMQELLLEPSETFDENHEKCSRCRCKVFLPKYSKEKKEERQILKERRILLENGDGCKKKRIRTENHDNLPEGRRLILCGCIYCRNCFSDTIYFQLQEQSALQLHQEVLCTTCQGVVLMNDLSWLSDKAKGNFYEQAMKNYLLQYAQTHGLEYVLDQCSACQTLIMRNCEEEGVYRCVNDKCRRISCMKCGGVVLNQMDFDLHRSC